VINFSIFLFAKVLALTAKVKKLASDVSAQSCPGVEPCSNGYQMSPEDCSCTCTLNSCPSGNLYNYQTCECTYYPVIQIAYDAQHALKEHIRKISMYIIKTSSMYEYRMRLTEIEEEFYSYIYDLEYDFSNKNKEEIEITIKEYEQRITTIIKESEEFSETATECTNFCDDEKAVLCSDCECRSTDETTQFRGLFDSFITIEADIFGYKGTGCKKEIKEFRERTKDVRVIFEEFFTYLVENNGKYCSKTVAEYVQRITIASNSLKNDFDAFKNKNDESKCNLAPCGASEVADMRACKCVYIKDYDQLQGIADKYQEYVNSIKALNLDETNTATFIANL
jgi:hypothetical protein